MDDTATRTQGVLLAFPPEILYEILRNLDLKSFLAVKQTCTTLRSMSFDKNLWHGFVQEFESRPGYSRLEAPWTDYTTSELTHWVLSRFRVEEFWRKPLVANVAPLPRVRSFPYMDGELISPILLPGGRWMLMLERFQGDIYVFDLEAPELKGEVLVEGGNAGQIRWFRGCWVDPSKPRLSVRVALGRRPLNGRETDAVTQVYNIETVGLGQDAKLQAKYLINIRDPFPGHCACALDGEYVVIIRKGPVSSMAVTRYCRDGQLVQSKPVMIQVDRKGFASVYLLWSDRIVLLTGEWIKVYSLDRLGRAEPESTQPMHSLFCPSIAAATLGMSMNDSFKIPFYGISAPISLSEAVRFTFAAKDSIWGINVPRDITVAPELKWVADAPFRAGALTGIGYQRSLFLDVKKGTIDMIHHVWDDSEAEPRNSRRTIVGTFPKLKVDDLLLLRAGYSEELGRIVIYSPWVWFCMLIEVI